MDRCSILHVEDYDAHARLFRAALEHAALVVSVYRVSDGEQAVAFLNKVGIYQNARQPDLVVLDLNMPRVDGWTVLRSVKEKAELKNLPIVVLSTSLRPEDENRALALGSRRYLTKPVEFDDWVRMVEHLCADFLPQATAG